VFVVGIGAAYGWRRDRTFMVLLAGMLAARLLFYARWWAWYGGGGWGPRFLLPVMPLFAVPLLHVFNRWREVGPPTRALIVALAGFSVAFQVVGATVDYSQSGLSVAINNEVMSRRGSTPWTEFLVAPSTTHDIDRLMFAVRHTPLVGEAKLAVKGKTMASNLLGGPRHVGSSIAALALGSVWLLILWRWPQRG
jgi:hypothetical protein